MNELSVQEIHASLTEAVCDISLQDAWGWYHHCGYVAGASMMVLTYVANVRMYLMNRNHSISLPSS